MDFDLTASEAAVRANATPSDFVETKALLDQSTGGFIACCLRRARFSVAQDRQMGLPKP
jgi:hypothetical protein